MLATLSLLRRNIDERQTCAPPHLSPTTSSTISHSSSVRVKPHSPATRLYASSIDVASFMMSRTRCMNCSTCASFVSTHAQSHRRAGIVNLDLGNYIALFDPNWQFCRIGHDGRQSSEIPRISPGRNPGVRVLEYYCTKDPPGAIKFL